MKIRVLLFAVLREKMQRDQVVCEVKEGETVLTLARKVLGSILGDLPWQASLLFAVNHEFAPRDYILKEGDEVALIPPVAGG